MNGAPKLLEGGRRPRQEGPRRGTAEPCRRPFSLTARFPFGVLGPVERRALARFARFCFSLAMSHGLRCEAKEIELGTASAGGLMPNRPA